MQNTPLTISHLFKERREYRKYRKYRYLCSNVGSKSQNVVMLARVPCALATSRHVSAHVSAHVTPSIFATNRIFQHHNLPVSLEEPRRSHIMWHCGRSLCYKYLQSSIVLTSGYFTSLVSFCAVQSSSAQGGRPSGWLSSPETVGSSPAEGALLLFTGTSCNRLIWGKANDVGTMQIVHCAKSTLRNTLFAIKDYASSLLLPPRRY